MSPTLLMWSFMKHSDVFSWVLNGSWRFWDFLWRCDVNWSVVLGSERLLKSHRCSLTFWSVPRRLWTYFWVLSSSERYVYDLKHSLTFWGVLMDFERLWKGPEGYEAYSITLRCSDAFWDLSMGFLMFQKVLKHSLMFRNFWCVLRHCCMF